MKNIAFQSMKSETSASLLLPVCYTLSWLYCLSMPNSNCILIEVSLMFIVKERLGNLLKALFYLDIADAKYFFFFHLLNDLKRLFML
jgi:hypothetical protein